MSQIAEKFASIDTQLAEAKATWAKERQELQDTIVGLKQEVEMHKSNGRIAVQGRIDAEINAGALQALFAVVRHVLDEAEKRQTDEGKSQTPELKDQLAKIDAALNGHTPSLSVAPARGSAPSPVKPGDANNV